MAADRVRLDKVFEHSDSDGPNRFDHVWIQLPMCAACATQHRAQVMAPTLLQRVASSFATFDMVGAVVLGMAALFCLWLALKEVLKGRFLAGAPMLVLGTLFVLFAMAQRRKAWDDTGHRRVPRSSAVAGAFDFSDDLAQGFEKPRFVVTAKNAAFAQAFEALNVSRLYHAESVEAVQEARSAKRKTAWVFVGFVVVALVISWIFGD